MPFAIQTGMPCSRARLRRARACGAQSVPPHHLETRGLVMGKRDCRNMPCLQCAGDRLLHERASAAEPAERPECESEIGHRRGGHVQAEAEDGFAIPHGITYRQHLLQMLSRCNKVALI